MYAPPYPDNRIKCTHCGRYDERWVDDGPHIRCIDCGHCRTCGVIV